MSKKAKGFLWAAIALMAAFVGFTLIVKFVGVEAIGPNGSEVGLAELNSKMREVFGSHESWERYTKYLGYLAIVIGLCFALIGLVQLIKGRSLRAVDKDIYCLGAFYADLAIVYVLFEKLVINYRPVLEDGELAASYPSSHTILIVGILVTAAVQICNRVRNRAIRILGSSFAAVLAVVAVFGRLISGVHWFTDIVGALILVGSLICEYCFAVEAVALGHINK